MTEPLWDVLEQLDAAIQANGGPEWRQDYCDCDHLTGVMCCEYCDIYRGLMAAKTKLEEKMNEQKTENCIPKQTTAARLADQMERMVGLLKGELSELHIISADARNWACGYIQVSHEGFHGDTVAPHGGGYLEVSKMVDGIKIMTLTESLSPETLALLNQAAKVKLGDV